MPARKVNTIKAKLQAKGVPAKAALPMARRASGKATAAKRKH